MDRPAPDNPAPAGLHPHARLPGILCLAYAILLLYGSLMPFDLTADAATVDAHLQRVSWYWPFRPGVHTSRADILSNVMLYVPLGLLAATHLVIHARRSRRASFLWSAAACAGSSVIVECVQIFSASRVASVTDVLMNTSGGVLGAALGALFGARTWARIVDEFRRRYDERPVTIVAGLLLLLLAADAAWPFLPTLDVGTVKHNVRASTLSLQSGFSQHPWHHWLVTRAAVYAALAALLGAASARDTRWRWLRAGALAAGFAAVAEMGKIFIVGREANAANVASSAGGALLGTVLGAFFERRHRPRLVRVLPVLLVAGYVLYLEWKPFTFTGFTWDLSRVTDRMPKGAEWIPLYHYAMGARAEDVRLFAQTLILTGALTYCASLQWRGLAAGGRVRTALKAALLGGAFGLVGEFGQFFLDRYPTVTDVFSFALGGALGAWVFRYYPPESPSLND